MRVSSEELIEAARELAARRLGAEGLLILEIDGRERAGDRLTEAPPLVSRLENPELPSIGIEGTGGTFSFCLGAPD